MTLNELLEGVVDQWPLLAVLAVVVWLSLPQIAERYEIVRKLVGPLSKRWQEKAEQQASERRAVWMQEGKTLVAAAIKEMTPRDVKRMEERLERVEDAEEMLKQFVIYDELWHFQDDHNEARHGRRPAHRMTFDVFESKWQQGWRPFDDDGKFVDDGAGR